ncbi:MAG TPA: methyltransferase domain-containing protein [Solirubrobacteraceae bacterium]|jgi:SAM-dependent methyltransferase|nr:methyltransferase domain-containing protein [Solirubrobacteraceae bacterium]
MTDWQERITAGTDPSVRAEHTLRYAVAAPIVGAAATWCDLGCGTGLAASHATDGPYGGRLVLVDVDEPSVVQAAAHLQARAITALAVDLDDRAGRDAVRAAVLDGPAPRAITCLEVLEHVRELPAVVELLLELAAEHDTTVILSVPNDAFGAIENPFHETVWSAKAFAELRAMLPDDHVFAEQVPLRGSRMQVRGADLSEPLAVQPHEGAVPSHFVAAFGPDATRLRTAATIFESDARGERSWTRRRESDLAYLEVKLAFSEAELVASRALAAEMDGWRRYIHDLEDRLGLPRAGSGAAMAHELRDDS